MMMTTIVIAVPVRHSVQNRVRSLLKPRSPREENHALKKIRKKRRAKKLLSRKNEILPQMKGLPVTVVGRVKDQDPTL
jgi:hypothetical protein